MIMRHTGRGVWRRTAVFGGIAIEVAVLVIALVLAGVLKLFDRRR
jgi:hypothetical protein